MPSARPGAVLRRQRNAERAQIVELGRQPAGVERTVGTGDAGAAGAKDGGEGQHSAAADSAEEILVGHWRAALCGRASLVQMMLPMKIAVVAPSCTLRPEAAEAVTAIVAARGDAELVIHPQCFLSRRPFRRARRGAAGSAARSHGRRQRRCGLVRARRLWLQPDRRSGRRATCRRRRGPRPISAIPTPASCWRHSTRPGLSVAHGPMVQDVAREGGEAAIHRALDWLVRRDESALEPGLKPGRRAMAFNLTVLSHLLGTADRARLHRRRAADRGCRRA